MKISLFSRNRGTEQSFEELVAPHVDRLYRLGYHYTGSREDAEDLVQDLLVKLFPRCKEMRSIEKLGSWMAKILYRLFIDIYRRKVRNPVDIGHDETIEHTASPTSDISSVRVDNIIDLQSAINQLNDDQRVLLLMHDVESYTLAEISTIVGTPIGTLKSRLHRSRAKLREIIKKQGTLSPLRACK